MAYSGESALRESSQRGREAGRRARASRTALVPVGIRAGLLARSPTYSRSLVLERCQSSVCADTAKTGNDHHATSTVGSASTISQRDCSCSAAHHDLVFDHGGQAPYSPARVASKTVRSRGLRAARRLGQRRVALAEQLEASQPSTFQAPRAAPVLPNTDGGALLVVRPENDMTAGCSISESKPPSRYDARHPRR